MLAAEPRYLRQVVCTAEETISGIQRPAALAAKPGHAAPFQQEMCQVGQRCLGTVGGGGWQYKLPDKVENLIDKKLRRKSQRE